MQILKHFQTFHFALSALFACCIHIQETMGYPMQETVAMICCTWLQLFNNYFVPGFIVQTETQPNNGMKIQKFFYSQLYVVEG
jgi:hypothetical protein